MRLNFSGDVHFVTFKTWQHQSFLADEKCCRLFLANLDFYRQKFALKIYGYCLLPDHVHLLIYLDQEKYPQLTISKVMHGVKGRSAQLISKYLLSQPTGSRSFYASACQGMKAFANPMVNEINSRDCLKIWQPGFYDFNIYTQQKFEEKLNYIHKNPLKHQLVDDISQYPYCSWRNYELADNSIFSLDYPQF